MTATRRPLAPLAVVTGGVAWTGWSVLAATTGSADGPVLALVGLSGLLLAVGLAGFVLSLDWAYQFPGGQGAGLAVIGFLSFTIGQGVVLTRGEGGVATWFVAPGVLAFVGGSALFAVGLVRARRTPPWLGVSLLVGSVTFLGFNGVPVLAVPFGLAWFAFGAHLWRYPERPANHLEPSTPSR